MIYRRLCAATLLLSISSLASAASVPREAEKRAAAASIDSHSADLISLSNQIWGFAETALRETRSSRVLADYAEANGFRVTRGVASLPTAFVAEYGSGSPVIAILGEYDALPGLSQKAQPTKEAVTEGAPGHGCGHNLFGAASLGAAIAVKELIAQGKLHGTVRFYGTPAEESVGGKLYMVREGLFRDVDVALAWHPDSRTRADTKSTQALVDFIVEFHGKAAHAAFDPWNGRSAADGLEIFTHAVNMMREHVKPSVRIHYAILKAGEVPNVVPDYAKVWCWARDTSRTGVEDVLTRLKKAAEGAALAADVQSVFTVQSGDYEMLVNMTGERLLQRNLEWLGPVRFTPAEQDFARRLQQSAGVAPDGLIEKIEPFEENPGEPEGGSTDVADVSWVVPVIHLSAVTAPENTPWHAWPVAACAGMSIGQKGLLFAARALSATAIDLFTDPKARAAVRTEFEEKTRDKPYKGFLPPGPPPVPKD